MKYILIGLLLVFILSRIKIVLKYNRYNLEDKLEVTISYLKIIKYHFHLSILDISKIDKEFGFRVTSSFKKKPEGFIDFKTIIKKVKQLKIYYRLYNWIMNRILEAFKHGTVIKRIHINTELGMLNNEITGISVGILYAVFWNVVAYITTKFKTINKEVTINPNFRELLLKLNIYSIFTIRIGNIIYVGLYILLLIIVVYFNSTNNYIYKTNSKKAV